MGLEAFGVALDDPDEAWQGERGERVAVGFDLEWEASGAVIARTGSPGGEGYSQPCAVYGDVLLGDERLAIDGWGWRAHAWGEHDWWVSGGAAGSERVAGHLDDGSPVTSDDEQLRVIGATRAPVLVTAVDGRVSRLDRSLCRFEAVDGRRGSGWREGGAGRV